MIERSIGYSVYGYTVGGGYKGKTEELDNIILEATQLLQKNSLMIL